MTDYALDWRNRLYRVADKHGMTGADHATIIETADRIAALERQVKDLDEQDSRECREWQAIAERIEAEARALRELLRQTLITMRHARVFITSREKMHPDGVTLWDQEYAAIDAALTGAKP